MLKVKRIYDPPAKNDGFRVLVDRLWPRGVPKQRARLNLWMKDIAPSDALRKWFGHDEKRWKGFETKYRRELGKKRKFLVQIKQIEADHGIVTLLYSAKDQEHNQAVALREFLKGSEAS